MRMPVIRCPNCRTVYIKYAASTVCPQCAAGTQTTIKAKQKLLIPLLTNGNSDCLTSCRILSDQ